MAPPSIVSEDFGANFKRPPHLLITALLIRFLSVVVVVVVVVNIAC